MRSRLVLAPPLHQISEELLHAYYSSRYYFFFPVSLHVICRQFIGEFILVDILVLWDVSVGAVVPRAARGPPEEALLLVNAKTKKGIQYL